MNFYNFFNRKKTSAAQEKVQTKMNCPNCWGRQEWNNEFHELKYDRQKDILNKNKMVRKAFIQKFVEKYITGVQLKKEVIQNFVF